jgi:hypothetical protein
MGTHWTGLGTYAYPDVGACLAKSITLNWSFGASAQGVWILSWNSTVGTRCPDDTGLISSQETSGPISSTTCSPLSLVWNRPNPINPSDIYNLGDAGTYTITITP